MMAEARALCLVVAALLLSFMPLSAQELRGHGGPVRSLALSADGAFVLSGSFDTSAIVWDIKDARAISVLRGHDGPVNATQMLPDGRFVTGGEDGRLLLWTPGREASCPQWGVGYFLRGGQASRRQRLERTPGAPRWRRAPGEGRLRRR